MSDAHIRRSYIVSGFATTLYCLTTQLTTQLSIIVLHLSQSAGRLSQSGVLQFPAAPWTPVGSVQLDPSYRQPSLFRLRLHPSLPPSLSARPSPSHVPPDPARPTPPRPGGRLICPVAERRSRQDVRCSRPSLSSRPRGVMSLSTSFPGQATRPSASLELRPAAKPIHNRRPQDGVPRGLFIGSSPRPGGAQSQSGVRTRKTSSESAPAMCVL